MEYDANRFHKTDINTLESLFIERDRDSPLLTASLAPGSGAFFYRPSEWKELLLAEERDPGRWNKGKAETQDERAARIEAQRLKTEETHQQVESGLEALSQSLIEGKSEQLLTLLNAMSRFHSYSLGNTILIMLQQPESTLVAGFTTWKEAGRYVKSGEKGIAILAPIPKRVRGEVKEERPDQDTEPKSSTKSTTGSAVCGFKVVYVFDVSQTDGKPLPEFAEVKGDPAHYLPLLKECVRAEGITLDYKEDIGEALGRSYGGRIEIKSGMSAAREFTTLVHEFAHELLHPKTERLEIPKTVKETEAEAVAYVVSRSIRLETGTASSDYIQLYHGNADTLGASLQRIQKTANQILSRLEEPDAGFFRDAA